MKMLKRMFCEIFNLQTPTLVNEAEAADAEIKRLADDLERKRNIAIERMGDKWVLHPNHHVKKMDIAANSLGFKTV